MISGWLKGLLEGSQTHDMQCNLCMAIDYTASGWPWARLQQHPKPLTTFAREYFSQRAPPIICEVFNLTGGNLEQLHTVSNHYFTK